MTRKKSKKSTKQIRYEIELFDHINVGDRNPSLIILHDGSGAVHKLAPTKTRVKEFVDFGTVEGRHDLVVGIRFRDQYKNKMAISLTRKEAASFLPFL